MKKIERELRREIEQMGLTLIEIERNKHLKLTVGLGGKTRIVMAAATPSSWRNLHHMRRKLRRAMRELTEAETPRPSEVAEARKWSA